MTPTPSTARVSDLMRAFNAQWLLKQAAQHAHEICNALRLKYPEFIELSDDGELHVAIHKILAVDTQCAAPMSNASIYQCHNYLGSGYDPDAGWDGNMIACGDCGGGLSPIRPTYYVRHPDDSYSVADPQPTAQLADLQGRLDKADELVAKYRKRLEIDVEYVYTIKDGGPVGDAVETPIADPDSAVDGIECRNITIRHQNATIETMRSENAALQAKIDALMLEYCEDEMTPEQRENWGKRQRRCSPEEEAAINAALDSQQEPNNG